jgi:hypothetical protein
MERLGVLLAPVLALAALSGCAATNELLGCKGVNVSTFTHASTTAGLERASDQPVSIGAWVENYNDRPVEASLSTEPAGTDLATGNATSAEDPTARVIDDRGRGDFGFFPLEVPTPENGSIEVTVQTAGAGGGQGSEQVCDVTSKTTRTLEVAEPEAAAVAQGGKGAIVHTVGWYTDGDPFFHTMDRYVEAEGPPAVPSLGSTGGEPLKVYVYNESSDEMPERYNESGYNTTIPGFNEALKGQATTGGNLAFLEPEEAYTREGTEDHPLYGDELVFYIEVVEVRTVPCKVPQPVCTPPDGNEVPG